MTIRQDLISGKSVSGLWTGKSAGLPPLAPLPRFVVSILATLLLSASMAACSRHAAVELNDHSSGATSANSAQNEDRTNTVEDHRDADDLDDDSSDELGYDLDEDLDDDLSAEYNLEGETKWQERSFSGKTRYTFSGTDNGTIKGEASGTASLLYRQQDIDVSQSPWVNWRWKISNTYTNLNEQTREGDDYPARFYVVVQTGTLPWQTNAINYVWSSNGTVGDSWNNPFTDNAKMLVLQSGDQLAGEWVSEKRDVVADFKSLFNLDITTLSGYAVMVDGDNSGSTGTSWFADIYFSQQ